jgi:MFS family permease
MGAAVLHPPALGSTTRVMPDERRGWAIGVFSTGGTVFLILGPLIGAAILALGDWRWLFVLNLPVLAFALVQAIRWIQPSRDPAPGLNIAAMLLLLAGLLGAVLGLTQISNWGAAALIPMAAGLTLLAVFAYNQSHSHAVHPSHAPPALMPPSQIAAAMNGSGTTHSGLRLIQ